MTPAPRPYAAGAGLIGLPAGQARTGQAGSSLVALWSRYDLAGGTGWSPGAACRSGREAVDCRRHFGGDVSGDPLGDQRCEDALAELRADGAEQVDDAVDVVGLDGGEHRALGLDVDSTLARHGAGEGFGDAALRVCGQRLLQLVGGLGVACLLRGPERIDCVHIVRVALFACDLADGLEVRHDGFLRNCRYRSAIPRPSGACLGLGSSGQTADFHQTASRRSNPAQLPIQETVPSELRLRQRARALPPKVGEQCLMRSREIFFCRAGPLHGLAVPLSGGAPLLVGPTVG